MPVETTIDLSRLDQLGLDHVCDLLSRSSPSYTGRTWLACAAAFPDTGNHALSLSPLNIEALESEDSRSLAPSLCRVACMTSSRLVVGQAAALDLLLYPE